MRILLIDDEASNGWKEVIEKVFFNGENIDFAEDKLTSKEKLKTNKYELIILDIRFGEVDHNQTDIRNMTGFQILTKEIRSSLNALNFSTPVLIFTASNKVWNINTMLDAGADNYYIKEHPDMAADLEFSRNNFLRLKGSNKKEGIIYELLILGEKRKLICDKVNQISDRLKISVSNPNICNRINEKLKIGYGILFRKISSFENNHFLYSNESLAFVVFWSILEEISKDCFENNWILKGIDEGTMKNNKWKLRKSGKLFIEDLRYRNLNNIEGFIQVSLEWDGLKYIVKSQNIDNQNPNHKFFTGKISLSLQIYTLMLLEKNWNANDSKNLFKPLNDYRNEVDFIHSSVSKIFNSSVSNSADNLIAFEKCNQMLDFILKLLND